MSLSLRAGRAALAEDMGMVVRSNVKPLYATGRPVFPKCMQLTLVS